MISLFSIPRLFSSLYAYNSTLLYLKPSLLKFLSLTSISVTFLSLTFFFSLPLTFFSFTFSSSLSQPFTSDSDGKFAFIRQPTAMSVNVAVLGEHYNHHYYYFIVVFIIVAIDVIIIVSSYSHTDIHSPSPTHTDTHTHTLSLTYTHTHFQTHSHKRKLTHTLSLSHSHTFLPHPLAETAIIPLIRFTSTDPTGIEVEELIAEVKVECSGCNYMYIIFK